MPGTLVAALMIAVAPAVLRWWWGRSLIAFADDALLPERLHAHNRRVTIVSIVTGVLLGMGWSSIAIWGLPLLVITQAAAGFPLRKALYQETWTLGASLSFFSRGTMALFGFWLLLVMAPWLVSLAGRFDLITGATMALILVAWNRYSDVIVRTLLRTRPIVDPAIVPRFEALVSRCGLSMPRFEYVPIGGGVLANAFALPSPRRSSVLFTETLLSRLTPDETVAICAHELAHLEYYDGARVRRLRTVNYFLAIGAGAATPIAHVLTGTTTLAAPLIWLGVLLATLLVRARHRQQNETASDLRAVELTGDGEALARALTTLHVVARVPRRWDQERERKSTHPSLARRIRDIRAAAGVATATLENPVTFRAAQGPGVVTFEGTRVNWLETHGATHVLDYAALVELRLDASTAGVVTLVAVEHGGRRWRMAPDLADLPALQSLLDVVDGRLAHNPRVPAIAASVTRLVAALGWLLAFMLGQFAFGFVVLLASVVPAPAFLNAAGTAAFAAAALILRDGPGAGRTSLANAAIVAGIGAGLFALARARRTETARGEGVLLGLLGASGIAMTAMIALGGFDPVRLHQGARSAPGAIVLLLALAAACWTRRTRVALQFASLAAVVGTSSIVVVGSTLFLDRVARDPFLIAAGPLTWTAIDAPPLAEFEVPFDVDTMRLSPHGRLIAVRRAEDDDSSSEPAAPAFHAGRAGGALAPIEADDLTFVGDDRALVIVVRNGSAEVRAVSLDGPPVVNWRHAVADIRWGGLTYDPRSRGWTVLGRDTTGRFVRVTGTEGGTDIERTTWNAATGRGVRIDALAARGGTLLAVEKRYENSSAWSATPLLSLVPLLSQIHSRSHLWRFSGGRRIDGGETLLDASCVGETGADHRVACSAFDGTRTHIVTVDPATGSIVAIALMDGRFITDDVPVSGWLTGWRGSQAVAIRLATGEAIRAPGLRSDYVRVIAPADTVIGTAAGIEGGARIRIYPLPGDAPAAPRRD
ncbi:MAG TPA: M48 family metallopeptidase [Vicinamibacterales bacterium]|nr:M48 family metallopeptidase [Vicinamibacterales bacterium]